MEFNGFTLIFIIILAIIVTGIWGYIQRLKYIREKIKRIIGEGRKENYKDKDLESIASYYKNVEDKGFYIDDITWNDLNMNIVFSRINNTQSSVGEEFLYNTLRRPEFNEDKLKVRDMA